MVSVVVCAAETRATCRHAPLPAHVLRRYLFPEDDGDSELKQQGGRCGGQCDGLQRAKHGVTRPPATVLRGPRPRGPKTGSNRSASSDVHGGVTHNNRRRVDTTRVSVRGRWTHATWPSARGVSLGHEERGDADTRHDVDGPRTQDAR